MFDGIGEMIKEHPVFCAVVVALMYFTWQGDRNEPRYGSGSVANEGQAALTTNESCSGRRHVVARGDTLSAIAVTYGTSVGAIMAANPTIRNPNVIAQGMTLCIP
ncbi:MAG: LysM domain protein [Microgenomates bacterium OLB23]|nr:MAG: LysM domain protein [Microgenomates bacterium OLB23]